MQINEKQETALLNGCTINYNKENNIGHTVEKYF